ncbi:MAG: DedA family protein [Gemmatales bacterium]|nr:DedA family protein [Gemmatales bacterium]MDW7993573.1 DedA family protein [Gemmatales bacterium]
MDTWLTALQTGLCAYGTIFASMLLVALVMPEEPALLAWGLAVGAWELHPGLALVAAVLGVMTTDLGLYLLGRWGGRKLLLAVGLNQWLSPPLQGSLQAWCRKSGTLVLITARLLPVPGLRTGAFVSAGMLHYPWWRFVAYDAVFLSVVGGVLVLGGYYCGDTMRCWFHEFDTWRYGLLLIGLIVIGSFLVWRLHVWFVRRLTCQRGQTLLSAGASVPEDTGEAVRSHLAHSSCGPRDEVHGSSVLGLKEGNPGAKIAENTN